MRLSPLCRDIPVVILSSSDAERDKADAERFGPASISASRQSWTNSLAWARYSKRCLRERRSSTGAGPAFR